MDVNGKVVIVTGAARGIGQEYVVALAGQGANVIAGDLADCADTLARCKGAKGKVIGVSLDVTRSDSAQAAVRQAQETFGRLDGLVNNAALYGALRGGRFDSIDEQAWDAAMQVNVKGVWICCKAAVPAMRSAGGGSIVNIASLAATYGMPYALHYTTSKAAVIGLTRGLARELGREKIRVNSVAPSAVLTQGTQEFFGEKAAKAVEVVKNNQAIPSSLEAGDLTGTVAWLLSDASRLVTGQTIMVDGGTVML